LKTLRKQGSRLHVDEVIDLFVQLLSAIEFLHSKRVLHRDIKTSNIFLKQNQLKLGDFGISRLMANTLDQASTFIGTPFYMSPETLRYDGYNMKADIWYERTSNNTCTHV
jgi:NIMA (never in mitosis gene a)-related kinase 11